MLLTTRFRVLAKKSVSLAALMLFTLSTCAPTAGSSSETRQRAIILGGGGPVGEAWESGVIAGLKESGIDLSRADLIIGTSAGAIVGARLASRMPPSDFINAALAWPEGPPPRQQGDQTSSSPTPDLSFLVGKLQEMNTVKGSQQSIRAEIGQWAQTRPSVVSESQFVASYKRRFPEKQWPSRAYECTSVETEDGSLHVWNGSSGVPLAVAVASSCALPGLFAPVTIDGHRYMDGGVRSVTSADLASGCKTALVLAPTIGPVDAIMWNSVSPLNRELQTLRGGGCIVELIVPDSASLKAFGATLGADNHRAPAFNAGRVEGRNKAGEIAKVWSDSGATSHGLLQLYASQSSPK